MMHLTPDELIDAMEGLLDADRLSHLSTCPACQARLTELADVLKEAKQSSIPEPSPLFWSQFSRRVQTAIDAEPVSAWRHWLRWQVLVPLGAVAALVAALMFAVPGQQHIDVQQATATGVGEVADDDNWSAVAQIVGEIDLETASAAGVIEPGIADQAVLHLTAEEQQELTRLLQAELTRAKS